MSSDSPSSPRRGSSRGEIREREELCPRVLRLRVSRPSGFAFRAGQRVKLGFAGLRRPYNLASAPGDPELDFCIERAPNGEASPRLWALEVGDSVKLRKPKGGLSLAAGADVHLFVASGTGVAPFRSLLRQALLYDEESTATFTLVHGAERAQELVFCDELEALAQRFPDRLCYRRALAEEPSEGIASVTEPGRASGVAKALAGDFDPAVTRVYACGHPKLVRRVRRFFEEGGFAVSAEAYWKLRRR